MKARRAGQVAVYLAAVLAAVCFLALMVADSFIATRAKSRSQDAGDAAALAAARRQGSLLNEIGRLNLDHVAAALAGETDRCERIVLEQRRLALTGPALALREASDAAEANGMETSPSFSEIILDHARDVLFLYAGGDGSGGDPFPEPYPGAWQEYADGLESAAGSGLAAGADNIEFYASPNGRHLLLMQDFYDAVAARDWCWFHFNCEGILSDYLSYRDWGPLPAGRSNSIGNSEVFSLHVEARKCALAGALPAETLRRVLEEYAGVRAEPGEIEKCALLRSPEQTWFFFEPGAWGLWFSGRTLAEDGWTLPVVGGAKEQYNVSGCAAVCRCESRIDVSSTGSSHGVTWSAAAKPFGATDDGGRPAAATAFGNLVVPCFDAVRLIPVDAARGGRLATADAAWVRHLRAHLPAYLERGTGALDPACGYCVSLFTWERASFRHEGVQWLALNSRFCVRPSGGGPESGGGTRRGH